MMHKHRKLMIFISIVCTLSFVLSATAYSIESVAYDNQFYYGQMQELGVKDILGVSDNDMRTIIDHTVDYLLGRKTDFQLQVNVLGAKINIYGQKEIAHMKDVQRLFAFCRAIKWVCLLITLLCLGAICLIGGWQALRLWGKTTLWTLLFLGVVLGIIGLWVIFDFDSFWTLFHKLSFTNDLWMLDVNDRMIQMFPAKFFSTVVLRICTVLSMFLAGLTAAAVASVAFVGKKRGKSFG